MEPLRVGAVLQSRLGEEGAEELVDLVYRSGKLWRDEVLELVTAKFELRLMDETNKLRLDMMGVRADLLRWSFVFWVTQLGAMAGLLAYMN